MDLKDIFEKYREVKELPERVIPICQQFCDSYLRAVRDNKLADIEQAKESLIQFLELVLKQIKEPFQFESYHHRITSPIDYHQFGLNFMRPLIDFAHSKVLGLNNVEQMKSQLANKENVILFANHQIEPDPQIINLLLEKTHPGFGSEIIFVAGDRVTTDPLAVPFSMGCNLLCIYSKKRMDFPPELKTQKQHHNQRTMKRMGQLLSEGGKCIFVAPSGGRDRPNADGVVEVSPFDPQSIELFHLISKQAEAPTHFYPLALATYQLLPPPESLETHSSEERHAKCIPAHMAFGEEIDMEHFPGYNLDDKVLKRFRKAEHIYNLVVKDYKHLIEEYK